MTQQEGYPFAANQTRLPPFNATVFYSEHCHQNRMLSNSHRYPNFLLERRKEVEVIPMSLMWE